jgi:hypothetical protein
MFTAERLVGRLDQVRQLGRRRRLRIQLPLGGLGMFVSVVSVVVSYSIKWPSCGGLGMALGPWVLLLCVMPTDARAIGLAIVLIGVLIGVATCTRLLALAVVTEGGCAGVSQLTCTTFVASTSYGVGWLLLHFGYALYLGVGLCGAVYGIPFLPSISPRTALNSLWQSAGSLLVGYAPYFLITSFESMRVQTDLFFNDEFERSFSINARATLRIVLGVEMIILGLLGLWPGLRVHAQSRLASMGEGVAAAAGIAALIVGCESVTLTEIARDTFRSVRLDKLQPHHLRTALRDGGKSTYALSTPAQLGSIDVRAAERPPRPTGVGHLEWMRERTCARTPACVLRAASHYVPLTSCAALGRVRAGLHHAQLARRPARKVAAAAGMARPFRQGARP